MLTDSTNPLSSALSANLLDGILNASLNGIIAYETVRDAPGRIIDFQAIIINRLAQQILHLPDTQPGWRLLDRFPGVKACGLFGQYVGVVETGEPLRFETPYDADGVSGWYDVAVVKLGDGFVITFNDITARKENALETERQAIFLGDQAGLMQAMLDGSLNGLLLLEPVYGADQTIIDFTILAANQAVEQISGVHPDQAINRHILTVYPGIKEAGYFGMYVETLQTGLPGHMESYYQDEQGLQGWFEVSAIRQDNTVVVTFASTTEYRRAEQELKGAAANLQAVIDNSQTGIFVFSPVYDDAGQLIDFRFKTINRMVAALVGQTPDVIRGDIASNWFVSYRETGLFDRYKHTYKTGEEQHFDINYNVDGFDVWFDVHSVKMNGDVLVTFTDYTNLKQTQLAQAQQAALLNSVLDGSTNGIMSFEAIRSDDGFIMDFRFLTTNEAGGRMVGKTADELIGQSLLTVFPGNRVSGLFDLYVRATQTGEPGRTEVYYKADGLDFWLDISAQKLGDGFVVTFTDVSLVKRAAQAVEQSATELQTVIDTAQTGIFLIGPVRNDAGEIVDFQFRLANQMLATYVGQESTAASGILASGWFPGYQTNGLFDRYKHTYETGKQQRFDFHYDSDNVNSWLDIMVTKIGDEILVTFSDYTPLKLLQQQLEASVIDLQRSNKNLEQFAYVASHDLQEPLRKIQAFGDILQTRYTPVIGEEGADMIHRMQLAAARMQVLIKDVLAYSRVATRRETVRAVDLNEVINEVLVNLETAIDDKRASVTVESMPTVRGDASQLRQLFQNLIGNALKFSKTDPNAGPPEVTLTHRPVRGRELTGMPSQGVPLSPADADCWFHLIEVADNGIGFNPHQAERIFQVFQRLHNRSEFQGTGIGLAIVQKVVENHQGYIVADGRPDQGATFRILLPVSPA